MGTDAVACGAAGGVGGAVLACPRCAGRMRFLATIDDPLIIEPILVRLGLPTDRVRTDPAQPPPAALLLADIA